MATAAIDPANSLEKIVTMSRLNVGFMGSPRSGVRMRLDVAWPWRYEFRSSRAREAAGRDNEQM
ncbi:hypothetical protein GCM10009595_17770 [Falsarthrobacter nasiphocae]